MAPKKFLFVNKNARSVTLSRAEGDETMNLFRHGREHIQRTKNEQTRTPVRNDGALAPSLTTLRIINSPLPPYSCTLRYPSAENQMWKADALGTAESWPVGGMAAGSATSTEALSQNQRSQQQHGATEPSLRHLDKTTAMIARLQSSEECYGTATPHDDGTPTLHHPICGKDEGIDPLNCTAIPIAKTVHQLLVYFESLWFPRTLIQPISSASLTSSGHKVMQECIFNDLQMNCVLACAGSRLENFHGHSIKGGSKQYVEQAIRTLRQRLSNNAKLDSKHIYAIMKLYIAESYRGNLKEALIRLHGARAAYRCLNSWTALDPHYTPTLCGMGEAYFLPKAWETPATFPTVADPGLAMVCFSDEVLQKYLCHQDGTAQSLLAYLSLMNENRNGSGTLRQVVNDMIEYAAVRCNMSAREYLGQPVPADVTQWAHLRRFAFVFRLMSIDAVKRPLFHSIRVALVIWLAIVVNFTGFERNLEIVAMHLRDITRLITMVEMAQNADVTAWILLLGAVVGDAGTRLWFVEALANSSVVDLGSDLGIAQWVSFLETTSQRCFYCHTIQRQSLGELANELYTYRNQLSSGTELIAK